MSRIEDALLEAARIRKAKGQTSSANEAQADVAPAALAGSKAPEKKLSKIFLPASVGAMLLLLLGGAYLYQGSHNRSVARPEPVAAPQPAPERYPQLPAVLVHTTPDPAYSRTHPGWERYRTEKLEYRVFRKKNAVQAVQVISLTEHGISHGLFNSLLVEIAGGDNYRINSAEKKEEFLMEKGTGENGHELLIYRKASNGQIKGFVASFTKPQ